MFVAHCPYCRDEVVVPDGVADDTEVRCPLCRSEFTFAQMRRRLPPLLEVVSGGVATFSTLADPSEFRVAPTAPAAVAETDTDDIRLAPDAEPASERPAFDFKPASEPRPKSGEGSVAPARTRPRSPARVSRKEKNPLAEIVKVVLGGVVGLGLAVIIIWWGLGKDPFRLGVPVARYVPWIVPAKFRGEPQSAATRPEEAAPTGVSAWQSELSSPPGKSATPSGRSNDSSKLVEAPAKSSPADNAASQPAQTAPMSGVASDVFSAGRTRDFEGKGKANQTANKPAEPAASDENSDFDPLAGVKIELPGSVSGVDAAPKVAAETPAAAKPSAEDVALDARPGEPSPPKSPENATPEAATPASESPKTDSPTNEPPKTDVASSESPKADAPKADVPKEPTEEAPKSDTPDPNFIGVRDAPRHTAPEIDERLQAVCEKLDAWRPAADDTASEAAQEVFKSLTELAQASAFTDHVDKRVAQSEAEISQALVDPGLKSQLLKLIREHAASQLEEKSSTPTGIVFLGLVKEVKPLGELFQATLEVRTGDKENRPVVTVVGFQKEQQTLKAEMPVMLLGSLVSNPKEAVGGYEGDASEVIWLGHVVDLSQQ